MTYTWTTATTAERQQYSHFFMECGTASPVLLRCTTTTRVIDVIEADYLCDIHVNCRTCDVVGSLTNAGTLRVRNVVRVHRDCDVSIDIVNVRKRGRRTRYGWTLRG